MASMLCSTLLATLFASLVLAGKSSSDSGSGSGSWSSGGSGGSGGSNGSWASQGPDTSDVDNVLFATYTIICLLSVVGAIATYQIVVWASRYIRTLACLNNDKQMFFRRPNMTYAAVKQHLFYAPLFRSRHNTEITITKGWSIGILPTRFQSLCLAGIIAMNVVLCVYDIEWSEPKSVNTMKHLRNRTGTMSVVNMIPLVILAGRNNPLIKLLGISFDSFNLLHRWFGRICAAQAVAHTVAWVFETYYKSGLHSVGAELGSSAVMITGVVGMISLIVIILQASALLRHAFYETFLHLHIALAITAIVGLWYHMQNAPDERFYLVVVIVAWTVERAVRVLILLYRNVGRNGTTAVVEALPGDALRVNFKVARPWTFKPGQHMFVTMPSIGLWTSHPFSVAWSEEEDCLDPDKGLASSIHDVLSRKRTSMSAIIRRRDGFTDALFKKVQAAPEGRLAISSIVEGPYGGLHSLHSYGTVMLFAGGVGISHQVPYVRDLVAGFANGTASARKVCLVWIIQSPEHLEWIRPWMTSILSLDRRRDILRIQLFVTRPRSTKEIHSPSTTVQMFPGRPNVATLIEKESESQVGAMAVSVCGTGGLADDVRRAVRSRQKVANIDLVEESFSW